MQLLSLSASQGPGRKRASSVETPSTTECELEEDLRQLVAGQTTPEFRFQPIADLQRAAVAGYEALARLPVRAGLAPDVCLQAAGRYGLRIELEALLARGALEARRDLPPNSFLCLNVSPSFLISDAWKRLFSMQEDLLRVVVEITEDQSISDYDRIRDRMAEIKVKGGMVAIDDAGAGYASLKHILELRPEFIKLDRNFVQHCDTDRAKSTLIETMGLAASRMDAWIIAEGVETPGELAELVRLGVPLAQGYFLGRPATAMVELQARARLDLETRTLQREVKDHLLLHAESCPQARTRDEADSLLSQMQAGTVIAITDQWDRPVALLEEHPVCGRRILTEFMRCQASSDLRETLQRALTRSLECRFDPVVLIENEGQIRGIARVDRMMAGLLRGANAAPRKPPCRDSRAGLS